MAGGRPASEAAVWGGMVALSSTVLVLWSLERSGDIGTGTGRTMVSVLLFQDLAVVPIMLALPLLAGHAATVGEVAWLLSRTVAVILMTVLGARFAFPWITARIVKKSTADGVVALAYAPDFEVEQAVDQHLFVYGTDEVGLSLSLPYEGLVDCLRPVQCVRSVPAMDEDEPLFKVAVVPIEPAGVDDGQAAPLRGAMTSPGFALVVSMNHTLGDGHT